MTKVEIHGQLSSGHVYDLCLKIPCTCNPPRPTTCISNTCLGSYSAEEGISSLRMLQERSPPLLPPGLLDYIVTRIAHRIGNGSYPLSHVQGARE